jgi:hypothetical protein
MVLKSVVQARIINAGKMPAAYAALQALGLNPAVILAPTPA